MHKDYIMSSRNVIKNFQGRGAGRGGGGEKKKEEKNHRDEISYSSTT